VSTARRPSLFVSKVDNTHECMYYGNSSGVLYAVFFRTKINESGALNIYIGRVLLFLVPSTGIIFN